MENSAVEHSVRATTKYAIEVKDLRKTYGKLEVLKGVTLQVERGKVFALLGPNGAGKTTTIRILATLLRADSGTAKVFGHDVQREIETVRSRISLTGQFAAVDEDLTGRENLILIARLLGFSRPTARARADELLAAFDLSDAANRQVKKFSGGMRRRLDIAASIVITPDLLFLDEPTSGLDPRSRNQVWDIVRALVAGGTTVLLTTQYLDEADQLADRIAVIDHGKIIAEGASGDLKASVGSNTVRVRLQDAKRRSEAEQILSQTLDTAVHLEPDPAALSAQISDPEIAANALMALSQAGVVVTSFSLGQPSLDEVFLALTGQPIDDETVATEEVIA
jgi:ABC-2 type transport system ATP-binding protein